VHGRPLAQGSGGEPTLQLDRRLPEGAPASSFTLVPGDRLTSVRGADAVEPLVTRTVKTTPSSSRYVGRGPFVSVEDSGTPGTALVTVGSVSGEEVSRMQLSNGSPMTLRREPAWTQPKVVALTFDDGPWRDSTDAILAQLKAAGVRATFFMTGIQLRNRPRGARAVLAAGMEIGTHSNTHKLLGHASKDLVRREIGGGVTQMQRTLGITPLWYRPAGGSVSGFVRSEAKRRGLRLILWSIDPRDWSRPGAANIVSRVLDRVRPGSVILMHDGGGDRSQTVEALAKILHGLTARGYRMVTLSELYHVPDASLLARRDTARPRLYGVVPLYGAEPATSSPTAKP
jgi:peptidoglycan/xylan/chitin deacetylase (PgdA/CDA1 family)